MKKISELTAVSSVTGSEMVPMVQGGVTMRGTPAQIISGGLGAVAAKATPVDADGLLLLDSAAGNAPKYTLWSNIKATLKTYFDTLYTSVATALAAVISTASNWTAPQRSSALTDNDLSLDLAAAQNFSCTPSGGGTLTFTNRTQSGQSGFIKLVNGSNYAIAAATNTKINSADLAAISASGTYLLSYFCDGTDVWVVTSKGLTV